MDPTPVSSDRRWPGMRTNYAWLPGGYGPTRTGPHQIGVSFSGHVGMEWESGGTGARTTIRPGSVVRTGPDGIEWAGADSCVEAMEIYPDPHLLTGDPPAVPRVGETDAAVLGIARALRREHLAGPVLTAIEISTMTYRLAECLGAPADVRPAGTLSPALVDRIADYVQDELPGPVTLDAMAAQARLSPAHFARAFKATTGLSPHRFVTARRLAAARTLLLRSRSSVVDVAHAVGYSNVSHFRRVFRRELGVLPGELRHGGAAQDSRNGPSRDA